uniref:Uncharacterized protein n=1 Tax=Cacopsylla melanoneura TaxID=428564 RepID=A0A8D8V0Q7_9HEMI
MCKIVDIFFIMVIVFCFISTLLAATVHLHWLLCRKLMNFSKSEICVLSCRMRSSLVFIGPMMDLLISSRSCSSSLRFTFRFSLSFSSLMIICCLFIIKLVGISASSLLLNSYT